MAITSPAAANVLSYEQYMAEEPVCGRYDIIEGVRVFMAAAPWRHQRILIWILRLLMDYEAASGRGRALAAPFDLLIRRVPRLQTRQPDVFFISHEALARGGGAPAKGALEVAPELVVDILSDNETVERFDGKLTDYCAIGVQECCRVWPETGTVDVLRLAREGAVVAAAYEETQSLTSISFPDLTVSVAGFFKP
jgi:Uma2 family endonuclease